jgi:chromosome segregation ATPase
MVDGLTGKVRELTEQLNTANQEKIVLQNTINVLENQITNYQNQIAGLQKNIVRLKDGTSL